MPFHRFPEESQCRLAIPVFRDIGFQYLTFVIHSPPKVVRLTVDFHKDLVQMPLQFGVSLQLLNAFLSYLGGEHWTKSVSPIPNSFMTDINAAFMKQVFDIAKREWKPDIEHYRKADDFGTGFEISKWAVFDHRQTLRNRPAGLNRFSSDSAALPASTSFSLTEPVEMLFKLTHCTYANLLNPVCR
jgi:hypothetical protein